MPAGIVERLPWRAPYAWQAVMRYYSLRAIPGVESCADGAYRRALRIGRRQAIVELREHPDGAALELTVTGTTPRQAATVRDRALQVFDLDAPAAAIASVLRRDPRLNRLLELQPGVRVPGAWNGFELAVRAILGQQISVKAATTIAGRIAARYGEPLDAADPALTRTFPTPGRLRRARFNGIGLIESRAATIRRLASAVAAGDIDFEPGQSSAEFRRRMTAIRGIGEWTAQYVLMRALKDPDALPAADLGLLRSLAPGERVTPAALTKRAEAWRPWRAYGAMLLWGSDAGSEG